LDIRSGAAHLSAANTAGRQRASVAARARGLKPAAWLLAVFALGCVLAPTTFAQGTCKGVKRKTLEQDIESFKRERSRGLEYRWALTNCREALPVLRKYVVDKDAEIRGLVSVILSQNPSQEALQLLVNQVEAYPAETNAVQYVYAYPCERIRKARTKSLAAALADRVRARRGEVSERELYVLGCLARRDARARRFLEEVRAPAYRNELDERLRAIQLFEVNLALAEAGTTDAAARAVAHIDDVDRRGSFDELQALVEHVQKISDRPVLLRLAEFIRDQRTRATSGAGDAAAVRLGDIAARIFTLKLGEQVTGEKPADETRRHTDAELEQIYRRVESHLETRAGTRQAGRSCRRRGKTFKVDAE
jgi:hypothetical protein